MTIDTSVGADDPRTRESGIDDEALAEETARRARRDGESVVDDTSRGDLTAVDIERGNDRNVNADDLGRSPKTNRLADDGIDLGKP